MSIEIGIDNVNANENDSQLHLGTGGGGFVYVDCISTRVDTKKRQNRNKITV